MKSMAVVPVKGLADAKKRLSPYSNPEGRRKLVLAMLDDVFHALKNSNVFGSVQVMSPDVSVEREASRLHAQFLQQSGSGLNSAVQQAASTALDRDIESLTIILADIPLAESRDFVEFHRVSPNGPSVVLSPSLKGGTNVMTMAPPKIIPSSYGRWSYARHLRAAQKRGIPVYSMSNPRLSFDIDSVEDLRTLRRVDASGRTRAGRVARELRSLAPSQRIS